MTSTTASPDDAVTSVVGYLIRSWEALAAEHVTGTMTPASLRELAGGLHIMGARLLDAADAFESGKSQIPISDMAWPAMTSTTTGPVDFDDTKALAWYRATYDDDETSDDLALARMAARARGQSLGPDLHGVPRRPGVITAERPF
jgi:hypothetical protein